MRYEQCLSSYTDKAKISEKLQVLFQSSVISSWQCLSGLGTAPLEVTQVSKEFKAIATSLEIRLNQNLDDWLNRAQSEQICLQRTIILVNLVIYLVFLPNFEKSQLIST